MILSSRQDDEPSSVIKQKLQVVLAEDTSSRSSSDTQQVAEALVNHSGEQKQSKTRIPTAVAARRPLRAHKYDANAPIEELCKGFKEEQMERLQAMRENCEARHQRFAQKKLADPTSAQHGPTRVYVHRNRSLMWCETPKAISTSWGRAVFKMEGRELEDVNYVWVHIFMQESFEYLSPIVLNPKAFSHVPKFDTYNKLLFVRDPFSRFLSAYLDKVAFPELTYHNLVDSIKREMRCNYATKESRCLNDAEIATNRLARCRRLFQENSKFVVRDSVGLQDVLADTLGHVPDPNTIDSNLCDTIHVPDCSPERLLSTCKANLNSTPSFSEFTQYVLEARDPKFALDRHWSPIALNCAPCSFPFTRVLRFESMTRDVECALREIYPASAYERLQLQVQPPTNLNINTALNAQMNFNHTNAQVTVYGKQSASDPSQNTQHISPPAAKANEHTQSNPLSMVRALRPRSADYKRPSADRALKEYYSQLSPELMQRLWDFYAADSELLDYPFPDFGLFKFKHIDLSV